MACSVCLTLLYPPCTEVTSLNAPSCPLKIYAPDKALSKIINKLKPSIITVLPSNSFGDNCLFFRRRIESVGAAMPCNAFCCRALRRYRLPTICKEDFPPYPLDNKCDKSFTAS